MARRRAAAAVAAAVLLAAAASAAAAAERFPVYMPCSELEGSGASEGMCRRQAGPFRTGGGVHAAARPREMPVDMRLPCSDPDVPCYENADVARPPQPPLPRGPELCGIELMPWSPFPCSFDPERSEGIPGQQADLCYTSDAGAPGAPSGSGANSTSGGANGTSSGADGGADGTRGGGLAVNLTTDGYSNIYYGRLPGGFYERCAGWRAGGRVQRLLLRIDFRLASGRQYDRTFAMQIGAAVAAFGTCSEPVPAKPGTADKRWSTTVDVTHLQPYIRQALTASPELTTRFRLDNVLSNVYNVPIWASATLEVYYLPPRSGGDVTGDGGGSRTIGFVAPEVPQAPAAAGEGRAAAAPGAALASGLTAAERATGAVAAPRMPAGTRRLAQQRGAVPRAAGDSVDSPDPLAPAAADVPDEFVPLVLEVEPGVLPSDSVNVIGGTGNSPVSWPNATFSLPEALYEPGDIYRAQVVVTPKGDGCEEFWAMNPSGRLTNTTCGGISTGEPYREIRVYLDGQLAGLTPIYYTYYTGGVDPRLWTSIVAHPTFALPSYTFDLSPWLGALNARGRHAITVEVHGASGNSWALACGLALWRAPGVPRVVALRGPVVDASPGLPSPAAGACDGDDVANATAGAGRCSVDVPARRLRVKTVLRIAGDPWVAFVDYNLGRYSNIVGFNNSDGTASWRQETAGLEVAWSLVKEPPGPVRKAAARKARGRPLRPPRRAGGGGAAAGGRRLSGARSRRAPARLRPGAGAARAAGGGSAWAEGRAAGVLTNHRRSYTWLNAGGISVGAVYELSWNETLLEPTLYVPWAAVAPGTAAGGGDSGEGGPPVVITRGEQRHYQWAVMYDVYSNPAPQRAPDNVTMHTAALGSTITSALSPRVPPSPSERAGAGAAAAAGAAASAKAKAEAARGLVCVAWDASAAFGGWELLTNDLMFDRHADQCFAPPPS